MPIQFAPPVFTPMDPAIAPAVERLCTPLLSAMAGLETAFRKLHPPHLSAIARALEPFAAKLGEARNTFSAITVPLQMHPVTNRLLEGTTHAARALDDLIAAPEDNAFPEKVLRAMRSHCRGQETLYPLHPVIRPIGRYFLEPPLRNRPDDFAARPEHHPGTGLQLLSGSLTDSSDYCLYVPETRDPATPLPLVVALHGGSGSGRDFIWTWLREARSRRFLLLAPSAAARTWAFDSRTDADRIFAAVDFLLETRPVRRDRLLLTGFSDGAIHTLTCGLLADSPFTALAPVSGVLHPQNLEYAKNRRIYMAHGALDWMFPIHHARQAHAILQSAGVDIVFRELPDLSHTYPREENARILEWFDPEMVACAGMDR